MDGKTVGEDCSVVSPWNEHAARAAIGRILIVADEGKVEGLDARLRKLGCEVDRFALASLAVWLRRHPRRYDAAFVALPFAERAEQPTIADLLNPEHACRSCAVIDAAAQMSPREALRLGVAHVVYVPASYDRLLRAVLDTRQATLHYRCELADQALRTRRPEAEAVPCLPDTEGGEGGELATLLPPQVWAEVSTFAARRKLTRRERDALALLLLGADRKEVAQELGVSEATIKRAAEGVFDKVGTNSRLEIWKQIRRDRIRHAHEGSGESQSA